MLDLGETQASQFGAKQAPGCIPTLMNDTEAATASILLFFSTLKIRHKADSPCLSGVFVFGCPLLRIKAFPCGPARRRCYSGGARLVAWEESLSQSLLRSWRFTCFGPVFARLLSLQNPSRHARPKQLQTPPFLSLQHHAPTHALLLHSLNTPPPFTSEIPRRPSCTTTLPQSWTSTRCWRGLSRPVCSPVMAA
jgi:hypothetical protein